jgi:diguanylate cyclase (GGDEF)-like protein/PAS domain S-box-containing protein
MSADPSLSETLAGRARPVPHPPRQGSGLVHKVALTILLVGSGMALALALASLYYVRELRIREHLEQTISTLATVESTARIACFTADPTLAKEVAQGLLANPAVYGVEIYSSGRLLAQSRRDFALRDASGARQVRRAVLSPFDAHQIVGEVVLVADPDAIARQAERDSAFVAALLLLQALAVTLVVAFAVYRTVVRPIHYFARALGRDPERAVERLAPPRGHETNEIGLLVAAFNRQMERLASLLGHEQAMRRQMAESERRFRTLAENSPDIILRHDRSHRLVFANPALVRELGLPVNRSLLENFGVPGHWRASIPFERYRSVLQRVLQTGQPERLQWDWLGAVGASIAHEIHIVPEYDAEGGAAGTLAIARNVTAHREAERRLVHLATHDPLTGLPNRVLLKDRLQQTIARCMRDGDALSMLFIDLDQFKNVNDTLGHDMGDELLKCLAERMRSVLRAKDTIARIGGDEFVVLLPEVVTPEAVEAVLAKLFGVISQPCPVGAHRICVGASIGVTFCPQDGSDIDTLMRNADTAMFAAKAHGRNTFRYFSAQMNEAMRENLQLSSDLRQALQSGEFELHYQPKIEVATSRLAGVEALIRWRHPQLGLVPPARFIPVAEQCGLINAIGAWVLEEACRQIRAWLDAGLPAVQTAVNLSAAQCEGADLAIQVKELLARHRLDGELLELEITESIAMSNADATFRDFWALRDLGVRLAIDDFGTGYSSLSYLRRLPVHNLKIDRSFTRDIESCANSREIVKAIVVMAHSLKLMVIAEGVETAGQLDCLRAAGCDQYQGYFACRPVPAQQMELFLRSSGAGPILPAAGPAPEPTAKSRGGPTPPPAIASPAGAAPP